MLPLNANEIIGTVKSIEHPITSPFRIRGSLALEIIFVFLPPNAKSKYIITFLIKYRREK